jgi:transcriptional regulator with XRE-family HTH domain
LESTENPAVALAHRLRALRRTGLPVRLTQADVAGALGRSEALISSWERRSDPVPPPPEQLIRYATFFCTARSIAQHPYRALADDELEPTEIATRDALRDELLGLRTAAITPTGVTPPSTAASRGPWHFPDDDVDRPIVIVCPELPPQVLAGMPQAHQADLDHSALSRLADLDALFELHGHIRAVNPDREVEYRGITAMRRDDSTGHLVVLGGVDWNPTQRMVMKYVEAPVEQVSEDNPLRRGHFQVTGDDPGVFAPVIGQVGGDDVLLEDVGYFFRGPNPFNRRQTVTLCNAMFSRGVVGAVRALTDRKLRESNAEFLARTFGDRDSFGVVFRVPIIDQRIVVTPDWSAPGAVLHTWSEKIA